MTYDQHFFSRCVLSFEMLTEVEILIRKGKCDTSQWRIIFENTEKIYDL